MKDSNPAERGGGWLEASGLPHIIRSLGLAVQPAKLGIALVAIVLTFLVGTVLDWIWVRGGGVDETAVVRFVAARELDQPYVEPTGSLGPFRVWRQHEQRCLAGFLTSSIPGASMAVGTPFSAYVESPAYAGPFRNLTGMGYGVWWMARYHPFYFLLFGLAFLIIWSWAGGAICRIAAVQFARDEKLSMKQGLNYAQDKLFGGFVLAPCIPVAFLLIIAVVMALGGALLRLPVLGDLLGGPAFILAILGGFIAAILLLGLIFGGSLLWPAVAAEGSDAFDAFSRSLSYPLSKPWKAILYAIIAVIFAGICWVIVNLFTFLALTITRGIVGFGTSPFGWWNRGENGATVRKLDLLWPVGGPNPLYTWPDWGRLSWYEYYSAFFIGVYVLLVIALMWSFLATLYFSASTVVYYLLRRDVDGTELEEVSSGDDGSGGLGEDSPRNEAPPRASSDVSLPISNKP